MEGLQRMHWLDVHPFYFTPPATVYVYQYMLPVPPAQLSLSRIMLHKERMSVPFSMPGRNIIPICVYRSES